MKHKPNFEEAKKYWRAYWERGIIDRPVICVSAPKDGGTVPPYDGSPANSFRKCMEGNYESLLSAYDNLASQIYFGGEGMPSLDITLGPDQYAGFLGVEIEAPEGMATTWSKPLLAGLEGYNAKIEKKTGGYFDIVKKYYEYGAAFSEGRFLLNMLDLHSNMDALSALRGPQELCVDIMDCPVEVHKVLNDVRKTYKEIFETMYTAGNMKKNG